MVGPKHHRGTAMDYYAGIDVSLEQSSVCVVDATGKIVREAKVPSEPEAVVNFLRGLECAVTRVGLEAGPLSQWLHAGLAAAGFEAVLLETRHVKAGACLGRMLIEVRVGPGDSHQPVLERLVPPGQWIGFEPEGVDAGVPNILEINERGHFPACWILTVLRTLRRRRH